MTSSATTTSPARDVVQQQATATDDSTVWQAGRDIITGNVFSGGFARLIDAWIPPDTVFDEAQISQFTGREWLIERIDRFIRRHDRGYVVIQAPAGIGKTAVAAWLAAERGWPCHFTRRRKGNVGATALRNLAAQIIAGYQLSDRFTPGGMLPETAGEPGWFDQVLRAGAAAATAAGQKLVVVVDGLDEAETFDGDLPLGLPTRLPRGVIMVVTCRTGSRLLGMRLPWEKTTFELADERNLADMRLFLERTATGDEEIATRLAAAGVTTDEFTAGLLDRCGGVWIYLRYILDALRLDLYSPREIDELPPDLITYYTEQLLPDDDDDTARTRLLVTLAAVTEPLPVAVLAELAGLPENEVEPLCAERLRPFLTCTAAGDDRRYAIYHVSLRDYLHGAYLESMLEADQVRAERLARRCRAAHSRIADRYLESWGGLHAGLPKLAADPGIAAGHGGYPLRNLVLHLDRANRDGDLHRLLATDDGGRNLWHAAHDRAGTLVDYVTDLRRVQRLVAAEVDADVAAGRPAEAFGLELRYTLMQAATLSLTNNVPPAMVAKLVEHGVWSPERGLAHARHLRSPATRVNALARLRPHLRTADGAAVRTEAVGIAAAAEPGEAAWAYLHLIRDQPPPVPESMVKAALDAAASTHDDDLLAEVLPELATWLGVHGGRAIALTATVEPEFRRVWIWERILPHVRRDQVREVLVLGRDLAGDYTGTRLVRAVAALQDPALAGDLLGFARSIGAVDGRAVALAAVVPLLPPADRPAVIAEALGAGRGCPEAVGRAWALGAVASVSPEADRRGLADEALAETTEVPDTAERVWVLTDLVGLLTLEQRRRALAECLSLVSAGDSDDSRVRMLADLIVVADEHIIEQVCDLASGIGDRWARAGVLSHFAGACDDRHLGRVLRCVGEDPEATSRAGPLTELAARATPVLAARILDEVTRLPSAYQRNDVMESLAPRLPAELVGVALDSLRSISDDYGRSRLFAGLAGRLPEQRSALLREAMEAARGQDGTAQARALVKIAAQARNDERAALLGEALDVATRVPRLSYRFFALMAVADQLDGDAKSRALSAALEAVRDAEFEVPRSYGLAVIARRDTDAGPHLLGEALAAAREHPDEDERPMLLAQLVGQMPDGPERRALLREALTMARSSGAWQQRAIRIALRIVELLPDSMVAGCLAAVDSFVNERELPDAVVEVIRLLPEPVIIEAIEACISLSARVSMDEFFGRLIPYLPARAQEIGLRHLLSATFAVSARESVLREAARAWPVRLGPAEVGIIRRCLDGTDLDECQAFLAAALDLLERLAGPGVHRDCLQGVRSVQRWWPRVAG